MSPPVARAVDFRPVEVAVEPTAETPVVPRGERSWGAGLRRVVSATTSGLEWVFGALALGLGLAVLAATPVAQFLSLGYLLEAEGAWRAAAGSGTVLSGSAARRGREPF